MSSGIIVICMSFHSGGRLKNTTFRISFSNLCLFVGVPVDCGQLLPSIAAMTASTSFLQTVRVATQTKALRKEIYVAN